MAQFVFKDPSGRYVAGLCNGYFFTSNEIQKALVFQDNKVLKKHLGPLGKRFKKHQVEVKIKE